MTIDEAIEHAIQIADSYKDTVPDCDYARDHRQLADWLRQVRDAEKYKAERNEFRELWLESRRANELLFSELNRYKRIFRAGPVAINALFDENTKLRELAREAMRLMQADGPDCGLCKHYDECWTNDAMDYSPSGCVICTEARELGIEVDE